MWFICNFDYTKWYLYFQKQYITVKLIILYSHVGLPLFGLRLSGEDLTSLGREQRLWLV